MIASWRIVETAKDRTCSQCEKTIEAGTECLEAIGQKHTTFNEHQTRCKKCGIRYLNDVKEHMDMAIERLSQ